MKTNKWIFLVGMMGLSLLSWNCTDLQEDLNSEITGQAAADFVQNSTDVSALLRATYEGMRLPYQDQSRFWAAQQHTSDETMGPTRGPDWDDNGVWRVLHDHTWTADHEFLRLTFKELLQITFSATEVLSFNPSPSEAAEARFLRAFVTFSIADGWGQVPYRITTEDLLGAPPVYSAQEAIDFVISECEAIINDLPDGDIAKANKDAARTLLVKAYLNRGTFLDRTNPSFPAADMAQAIKYADEIINSGKYSVADNFYDNFAPRNNDISSELIFTNENRGGESSGNVRSRWMCTLHYSQNPSGWNGFTTIADFYNKFEDGDVRKGADYAGMTDVSGITAGFLVGQQFDQDGNALNDRAGNPLAFTPEIKLIETGSNLEVTGIRVVKYPIDYVSGDNADNDYVFFRYSDVLLMKAEAILRSGGSAGDALALVNEIRAKRGLGDRGSLSLDNLIDERGFELYWEGHRRQDLIRFGKFLDSWNEKGATGSERLLFPIPNNSLATNPNLQQNPGY